MTITTRQTVSPREAERFNTAELRDHFLIDDLFSSGEIRMTYSHLDRTIVGGACPINDALLLPAPKAVGNPQFLDRRELGVFCIAGQGQIDIDGETIDLAVNECLYIPMGCSMVSFISRDSANPAQFYFVSAPAHHRYEIKKITPDQAIRHELGTQNDANVRVLRQYIHPDVCPSCQLVMGMTSIADGSVWNTMPCHTHDRRSEVYLYFDMAKDTRVFHFMGEPTETRHLVVASQQAVLSPGWSIHCGAATGRYSFIWSMAGDNQDFTDMDFVAMDELR